MVASASDAIGGVPQDSVDGTPSTTSSLIINAAMKQERKAALLNIGFDFDPQRTKWEEKFKELVKFKQEHGHCRPTPRKNDPQRLRQLGIWVKCQRRHYTLYLEGKPSAMTLERIERLNEIGFVWSSRVKKAPPT